MARARNIKPSFFMNEELGECSVLARLVFAGLWCIADREGRLKDKPKQIKIQTIPYDEADCNLLLDELVSHGFIKRYRIGTERYIQVLNFLKHQNPHHKEVASIIPPPEGYAAITKESYDVSNELRESIFIRDGHKCLCCGSTENLQIDHVNPLAKGGNNNESNLQTLCNSCNSSKKDKFIDYRKPSINQEQVKHESSMSQACVNESASCPTDSLLLNPESFNLNPEEIKQIENDSPQSNKSNRGTRLPDDFVITDDWLLTGKELRPELPDQEIKLAADKFIDYWHAATGSKATKLNWLATWRNWIRSYIPRATNVHRFPDRKPSMQANVSNFDFEVGPNGEVKF